MSSTVTINFDSASEIDLDPTIAEVSGGKYQLLDLRPTDSIACFKFSTDINSSWTADGSSYTGVATGGAAVSGGKLDLAHDDIRYVSYATSNFPLTQTGCLRNWYTPNYSGSPASRQTMLFYREASSTKNLAFLAHYSTGAISVLLYDENGSPITNEYLGSWSPTAGQEYEIEINFDITAGATRVFIAGVQIGSTITDTGTRSLDVSGEFVIGTNVSKTETSNFSMRNLIIFDTVQHTTNYTPGDAPPETPYDTNDPIAKINESWNMLALLGFAATVTETGSDAIGFVSLKDGARYYYNSGWVSSDGSLAQSNTAAEILANIATFTTARVTAEYEIILHSDDGFTTPGIDQLTFEYSFAGDDKDSVNVCRIWFWSFDPDDEIRSRTIYAAINKASFYKNNIYVSSELIASEIDEATGYVYIDLYDNANMTGNDGDTDIYYNVYNTNIAADAYLMEKIQVTEVDEVSYKNIIKL